MPIMMEIGEFIEELIRPDHHLIKRDPPQDHPIIMSLLSLLALVLTLGAIMACIIWRLGRDKKSSREYDLENNMPRRTKEKDIAKVQGVAEVKVSKPEKCHIGHLARKH